MAKRKTNYWMLVARDLMHLSSLEQGKRSWWCVSKEYTIGDLAFVYQPGTGVLYHLRLGAKAADRSFCTNHRLQTVNVEMLEIFAEPVSFAAMKANPALASEVFIRRSFQGSVFNFENSESAQELLRLNSEQTMRGSDNQ